MVLDRKLLRFGLAAVSAASTVVAVIALVPVASAQMGVPDVADPVALSTPTNRDVLREIQIDPFLNTVDLGRRGVRGSATYESSGAAVGTPDIAYNSADPIDGSVTPVGTLQRGMASAPPKPGAAPAKHSDPFAGVVFTGYVSGDPPLAVLRLADGTDAVYSVGDSVEGRRIRAIAGGIVVFDDGHRLSYKPSPVAVRGSAAPALSMPTIPGVPTLNNAIAPGSLTPGGGSSVNDIPGAIIQSPASLGTSGGAVAPTIPAGSPDAENQGHMPLSPALPGSQAATYGSTAGDKQK